MNQTAIVIVALAAALGILGVVVIMSAATAPEAEAAGCQNGLPHSAPALNASKGRCFHP